MNSEAFLRQLETAIDRRENSRRGGVYLLKHDSFTLWDISPATLSRLTDSRGYILADINKPFWWLELPEPYMFPDTVGQAKELWALMQAAQEYRSEHKFDSFGSLLDWLTQGIPSGMWTAHMSRAEDLVLDPNWYNFFNYITFGSVGTVNGAINPEEEYSLQHWLDMLGTALLIYGLYKHVSSDDFLYGIPEDWIEGAEQGTLKIIEGGNYSASEIRAAEYLRDLGNDVTLRPPTGTRSGGGTSDLIVNGINYDVYTPTTSNPSRIISAIAKKNSQTVGIVLDLSETSVTISELGDILSRVEGAIKAGGKICNIKDIIILP